MLVEPHKLFGNLDELCHVRTNKWELSHRFYFMLLGRCVSWILLSPGRLSIVIERQVEALKLIQT